MKIKYNYDLPDNPEGQEDFSVHKYDLAEEGPVKAIYTQSLSKIGMGNPFIEALPRPRESMELTLSLSSGVRGFDRNEILQCSKTQKIQLLNDIYTFRVPLLNERKMESLIYNCFVQSYSKRTIIIDPENSADLKYCERDQEYESKISTYSDLESGADAGILYCGYAGGGKSHSIKRLLGHTPQVIIHSFPDYGIERTTQITYLVTECTASKNADFSSLLNDIGASIDRALENRNHLYETKLIKLRKIDDKLSYVQQLIETFAIGIIVIDEIEVLDPTKNALETYSKLLRLTNKTKVNMILVGTEDSFNKLFVDLKMRRRFQTVNACGYCENKRFFEYVMTELFQYQYFDPVVPVRKPGTDIMTDEFETICDTFYKCTHGIIGLILGLYEKVTFEYIRSTKKLEITSAFIEDVSNEYYHGIIGIIDNLKDPLAYNKIYKSIKEANDLKAAKIAKMDDQEMFANEIYTASQDQKVRAFILLTDSVFTTLKKCKGDLYKEETIKKAITHVMTRKGAENYDEIKATREALKALEKMVEDRAPKRKIGSRKGNDNQNLFGTVKE